MIMCINPNDPSDANEDPDHDLLLSIEEYYYWTNPLSSDSDLDTLTDYEEIHGVYGYVSDPNNADIDNDLLNDPDEVIIYGTDPWNPDTDGDSILDGEEVIGTYGHITDPADADSDNDLMPDGWELYYSFYESVSINPNVDDAILDVDGDGLNNLQE